MVLHDALPDDPLKLHVAYLEEELKKIEERAAKLEAMIAGLEGAQKKIDLQRLIARLRDEANEYRKYVKLMKQK
jgi:hypothetical protein